MSGFIGSLARCEPAGATAWADDGRAFVVNRNQTISHIVMLDRFGASASGQQIPP